MKVTNKELLHIHQQECYDDIWQVGNIINIDNSYNAKRFSYIKDSFNILSYYFKIYDFDLLINKIEDMVAGFLFLSDEEQLEHKETIDELKEYMNLLLTYRLESALEVARKNIDENLPSRIHSIWLTDNENLDYWKSIFIDSSYVVYELNLDGELFKTSDIYIPAPTKSFAEIVKEAENYWRPNINEYLTCEYLFQGKATILRKL